MEGNVRILESPGALRSWADKVHQTGDRIALVPTMGALHGGHLALVQQARLHAKHIAVSIFVNPIQFNKDSDLNQYPRSLPQDVASLTKAGLNPEQDIVFAPKPMDMYHKNFNTFVVPEQLANRLCGLHRPGHFRGVCTVVLLLLRMSRCHVAVFGEKDYQQLQVIRRMVDDLWLDVTIVPMPTHRDIDGLALSSRNALLTPGQRQQALALPHCLDHIATQSQSNQRCSELLAYGKQILTNASGINLEYLDIVDGQTLESLERLDPNRAPRCLAAIEVGQTRLIDNRPLLI